MVQKEVLLEIGLSNNETEIYLTLLKLGEALASQIAEETKISRPHVYDSIRKIIEKGMATYVIKNGRKYFKPTDPIKILDYVKEKELELQQKEKAIREALPELSVMFRPLKEKPKVEVYEGGEGIKTILNDIIRTRKEMLAFNTLGEEFLKVIPEHFLEKHFKERKRLGIKSRQFYTEGTKILKHKMARYKKISRGYNQVSLFVYGDNVVMFILIENPLTIKIKSKKVAKLYKAQFELIWNSVL